MKVNDLIKKSKDEIILNKEELEFLLSLPPDSEESFLIMAESRRISKELSNNKAEVHAQFAINLSPCPKNCEFCSFSITNKIFTKSTKLTPSEAVLNAQQFEKDGANAIFLMTTANFDLSEFCEISKEVKNNLKKETILVANVGDKSLLEAKMLKTAGFTGVYHAFRIGEGKQTDLEPKKRLESIMNFKEAGLSVGTCVEPVGPEHSNSEIANLIEFTSQFDPAYSGAARRIPIPNTKMAKLGMISELRMSQIVGVTRLGIKRSITGLCTHEPCVIGASAGANLFWAECGANPRDITEHTEKGRGATVNDCRKLFWEAEWGFLEGPSLFYGK